MSLPYSSTMANPDAGEGGQRGAVRRRARATRSKSRSCRAQIVTREADRERDQRRSWRSAARPTRCCISWRSRTRPASPWTIDDFERIRQRVPVLCDLKPSGRYVATDLHRAGGVPQVMKMLLDHGLLHGDCMTITGADDRRGAGATCRAAPRADQDVIRPWSNPMYAQGHLAILRGNLATEGCVAKITGLKNPAITGPARVFDSEEAAMDAIMANSIRAGDVVVIRYEGPKGGPGMREMLSPTSALIGQGLGEVGRPHHRRPLLRRHVRHGRRARRAGSGGRRHDRADRGRRLDHDRRAQAR